MLLDVYIGWLEPIRDGKIEARSVATDGVNALDVAASIARLGAINVGITVYITVAEECSWEWARRGTKEIT